MSTLTNQQIIAPPGVQADGTLFRDQPATRKNLRESIKVPLVVSTINSLFTLNATELDALRDVRVLGYTVAGDGGGQSLRYDANSTATIDGGFVFPGPGGVLSFSGTTFNGTAGTGRFIAVDRSVAYADRFGVKADWVYPFTGTDNAPILQRCINAISALATAESRVINLYLSPGNYRIASPVASPHNVWWQAKGANIWDTRATAGRNSASLTVGSSGVIDNAVMTLPAVHGYVTTFPLDEIMEEGFVALRLENCANSNIRFQTCNFASIAIQLRPRPGGSIAYNQFSGIDAAICRIGLDLRGNTSVGWVNENSFIAPNFSMSSAAASLGARYGVRLSAEPSGYSGQNNNRFIAPCFQVGTYDAANYGLTVGKVVSPGVRYNYQDREYHCTVGGTVATLPTQTDGSTSAPDANGVRFRHVGVYNVSPVHMLGAGSSNWFKMCRWESGYGPFCQVTQGTNVNEGSGNNFEVYGVTGVTNPYPYVEVMRGRTSVKQVNTNNRFVFPTTVDPQPIALTNLHKRFLASATHGSLPGFNAVDYFVAGASTVTGQDHWAGTGWRIGETWLHADNSAASGWGTLIDMTDLFNVTVTRTCDYRGPQPVPPQGRMRMRVLNDPLGSRLNWDDVSVDVAGANLAGGFDAYDFLQSGTDSQTTFQAYKSTVNPPRYFQPFFRGMMTDIVITPNYYGLPEKNCKLRSVGGIDPANYVNRQCFGTPTIGIFDELGEVIANLDTTGGQPREWQVTRRGVLAPAWTATTLVFSGEYRANAGNIYIATTEGTTGSSAPTGTGTAITDGTAVWRYVGLPATLVAASTASLATVATTGSYLDLINRPTLGTAAAQNSTAFATAAQGALAATAVQPADLVPYIETSEYADALGIDPAAWRDELSINNVNNTSDLNKPISTATQNALNAKQNTLVSGTSIRTVNGNSLLGSGDVAITVYTNEMAQDAVGGILSASFTYNDPANTISLSAGVLASLSKADTAVQPQDIPELPEFKTINGESIVGVGDIAVSGGSGSPGGSDRQIQFNNASAFAGAANIEVGTAGNLLLVSLASQPAAPPTDRLQVYSRKRAGADWLEVQRPTGREIPIQPHFGFNRIGFWAPSTSTTVNTIGIPRTSTGTVSTPGPSSTNLSTSIRRWRVTSAATTPASCDERTGTNFLWRGNANGLGGFTYTNRLSLAILPATARGFFGLFSSTGAASTSLNPETLTNCIGIGFTEGVDANFQLMHNDSGGSVTKVDLGLDFAIASLEKIYTIVIYCPSNAASFWIRVIEETTGTVFESELTTNIPNNTTFMSPRNYMNNGTTAAACAYECSGVYVETDY